MAKFRNFQSEEENKFMNSRAIKIGGGLLAGVLAPGIVHACACGCGIFDVGGSSLLPDGPGGIVSLSTEYVNQNRNWNGTSKADPDLNDDKHLQTEFTTLGLQYMFNYDWGIQGQLPYTFRYFKGTDDNGDISTHSWSGLGDVRVNAVYTGFSDNLSSGVTLGLKLPTGRFNVDTDLVDRDTQLGTGSTDVLVGGFYRGDLGQHHKWDWFTQGQFDLPTFTQQGYRPGIEFNSSLGIDYKGFRLGSTRIIPLAQVLFSEHTSDHGVNADPLNTGYQRVLLSPGIEVAMKPIRIYADAEVPVYQNFTGNQLAAPVLFKLSVSWAF